MEVKDYIDKLASRNREVHNFIEQTFKKTDADKAIVDYCSHLKHAEYNSGLSLSYANVLQFCSDPKLGEQFEGNDIEKLYDSLLQLNKYCSDIYIDAANFALRLGNKRKAQQIIEMGIVKLKTQLAELENLANDKDLSNE